MLKKPFLTFFFLPAIAFMFTQAVYGQEWYAYSLPSDDIIANYKHLSPKELFDTANYHSKRQSIDTALICYNLVVNTPAKDTDAEHRRRIIDAYNESGLLYIDVSDYRKAYELLIKALDLCEKYQEDQSKTHIYIHRMEVEYILLEEV